MNELVTVEATENEWAFSLWRFCQPQIENNSGRSPLCLFLSLSISFYLIPSLFICFSFCLYILSLPITFFITFYLYSSSLSLSIFAFIFSSSLSLYMSLYQLYFLLVDSVKFSPKIFSTFLKTWEALLQQQQPNTDDDGF